MKVTQAGCDFNELSALWKVRNIGLEQIEEEKLLDFIRLNIAYATQQRKRASIWKPMHEQPIFRMNPFVTREGNGRARTNAYIEGGSEDVGMDIFERGLCLPSDKKMTAEEQVQIIEIIKSCFM